MGKPAPHPGDPIPPRHRDDLRFPDGFLWGCQTAPTQVEGGDLRNDMIEWARTDPKRVADGSVPLPGLDHWNRLERDYAHLEANGHGAHAFGVDWSRIEPEEGRFEQDAIDHYKREIAICRAHGMEPVITLLHFAIPSWLTAKGGILSPDAPALFERFCRFTVEQIGEEVTWWNTLDEPNAFAGMSYMEGLWPPGKRSIMLFFKAMTATLHLHAAATRAIRSVQDARGRRSMVSIAHNLRPMHPARRWNPLDRIVARVPDYLINRWFVNSVEKGRPLLGLGGWAIWRTGFGGWRSIPGLKGSFDFIGLNYYTRNHMRFDWRLRGDRGGGTVDMTAIRPTPETTYPADATYDPDGLYETAMNLWGQFRLPIMVTENGVPDLTERNRDGVLVDQLRPRFLIDTMAVMHHLLEAGVPMLGYMHWTDWDNWEWAAGWRPKFGLFSFDPETGEREDKFSATVFETIARRNAIPAAWLTAENRQSPVERDELSRRAAEAA